MHCGGAGFESPLVHHLPGLVFYIKLDLQASRRRRENKGVTELKGARISLSVLMDLFQSTDLLEKLLGVSRKTIRRYIKRNRIPPKKKEKIDFLGDLVGLLLGSWNEKGVVMWFTHSFPIWDKACPLSDKSKDPHWQGYFVPIEILAGEWDPEDPKVKYLYKHVQDNAIGGMT